jgi:diadenosine tetraphosphate (Ap4A) HIT family hydrolase
MMHKKLVFFTLALCTLFLSFYFIHRSSSSDTYCAFCDPKVIEAQKFYEDDVIIALYTHKPAMPGHCLIIPKRHVERFESMTDQENAHTYSAIKKINKAASRVFETSSYLLLQKNGRECGQSVPHVHFHYIPRKAGDDSVVKLIFKIWIADAKKPIDPSKMKEIVEKMEEAL